MFETLCSGGSSGERGEGAGGGEGYSVGPKRPTLVHAGRPLILVALCGLPFSLSAVPGYGL